MTQIELDEPILTDKDFASDNDIRWCPGCGDYSILAQMKKMLPKLNVPRENVLHEYLWNS
jgi:2-oxoglutarate ferredoxin oxidoreductase subunit beta